MEELFEIMEDFDNETLGNLEQLDVWDDVIKDYNSKHGTSYKVSSVAHQYIAWQRKKQRLEE